LEFLYWFLAFAHVFILNNYGPIHESACAVQVFGSFFVTYWTFSIVFAIVDFGMPAILAPFKIQESVEATWAKYTKCLPLVVLNQVVLFGVANLLWYVDIGHRA
jgi:hypothetical protein